MIGILIGLSLVVMIASLVGVITVWSKLGALLKRNLLYLVSFSAGVFLVVTQQLVSEVVLESGAIGSAAIWIGLGAGLILLISRFLPNFHHHHQEADCDHGHDTLDARRILIGDAIHNLGDGILLAGTFLVNPALGVITGLGIFVHELVQEISEFFVLKEAGYSTKRALTWNFAVSSTILIGAVGGYLLIEKFGALEIPLLGITAGAFLVIVFIDLIPHSVRNSKGGVDHLKHVAWFLVGALLMFGVNLLIGDTHTHGAHGHGHHDHARE